MSIREFVVCPVCDWPVDGHRSVPTGRYAENGMPIFMSEYRCEYCNEWILKAAIRIIPLQGGVRVQMCCDCCNQLSLDGWDHLRWTTFFSHVLRKANEFEQRYSGGGR